MKILKFINTIKLAIIHNKQCCTLTYHKLYLNFLNKLIDINLIKSYKIKNNLIFIKFVQIENQIIFSKLLNFYSLRRKRIISSNILKKSFKQLTKGIYFIMTSKGLKTHIDLIRENKGGIILFKISR